jgi:hypothetical protein
VVPHVPVCMYAHVREGDMHIAERVKKKMEPTGTGTRPVAQKRSRWEAFKYSAGYRRRLQHPRK